MIAEVILGVAVVVGSLTLCWLWLLHGKDVRRIKEENVRRDRLAAELEKERFEKIQKSIYSELKTIGIAKFRLGKFAQDRGHSLDELSEIARWIYKNFSARVVADGVVTPQERGQLDSLARALELDPGWAATAEADAKTERFRAAVDEATSDRVVTFDELKGLESLRRSLGLAGSEARSVIAEGGRGVYFEMVEQAIDAGGLSDEDKLALSRLRQAAFSDGHISREEQLRADAMFRKAAALVLQDGLIEECETDFMDWLCGEIRPSEFEVDSFKTRAALVSRLNSYREGKLPSVPTSMLLESGELCHWNGPCQYLVTTQRGTKAFQGDLVISNRKVRFLSAERSIAFAPSKIMDVVISGRSLLLTLDLKQGSAHLVPSNPTEVEAILVGVARKNKFTADYSSMLTRHIPDHVKREVWARDGGQCARCSATDYLEFDHVIPHAQGGANTLANVQVLCRRCNGEKSDRI